MKLLAIETSTSACSAALRANDEILFYYEEGNNIHSQKLLPEIANLLAQAGWSLAELDAIAVGQGPGSFTGLRIGVGVAQGLAYGASCPMFGIGSLAALAQAYPEEGPILSGIDARMGEIYLQAFRKEGDVLSELSKPMVLPPERINLQQLGLDPTENLTLIGNAWSVYQEALLPDISVQTHWQERSYPHAREVLLLAEKMRMQEAIRAQDFAPLYVRDKVAKKKGES